MEVRSGMVGSLARRMRLGAFIYRMARWHGQYVVSRQARPLACGYYLTNRCNFRCAFCNIWRHRPPFTVPEEKAKDTIRQLGDLGLVYFSISGGEPLLVPYVFDLLAHARACGVLYTHLVSNGFLMDEARARELDRSKLSEVSFSLDGPPDTHDTVRGQQHAYAHVLQAVENVKRYAPNTAIVINTILDPHQPEHALHSVATAKGLGVAIKVQPLNAHPNLNPDAPEPPRPRELNRQERDAFLAVIKTLRQARNVVSSHAFLDNYAAYMLDRKRLAFTHSPCIYGYHHVEFFNNQLFPCLEGLDWHDGFDPYERPLEALFASPEYRQTLERLRGCQGCLRNYYVCYYEPRLSFPIWNLVGSRIRSPRAWT